MTPLRLLFLILFFSVTLFAKPVKEDRAHKWSFGISKKSSMLTKFKDANVALQAWFEDMGGIYDVNIEVNFYDKTKELYRSFLAKEIDVIVIDTPFFFKHKDVFFKHTNGLWSLSIDNEKFSQYYLIGNKSKSLKGFKNFKNMTLSIREDDETAKSWLNKNSYEQNKKSAKKVLKKINEVNSDRRVLLNVFFKKTDYAIITKKVWEDMIQLNPAIKKRVEVLAKSKKIFIPFIGMHGKWSSQETKELFYKASNDLRSLKGGEKVIDMLKFNSVYKLEENSLNDLSKYFEEYYLLEKKYK